MPPPRGGEARPVPPTHASTCCKIWRILRASASICFRLPTVSASSCSALSSSNWVSARIAASGLDRSRRIGWGEGRERPLRSNRLGCSVPVVRACGALGLVCAKIYERRTYAILEVLGVRRQVLALRRLTPSTRHLDPERHRRERDEEED